MKRIWHPWWKWECYRHGLYSLRCDIPDDDAASLYAYFLRDLDWFRYSARRVIHQWIHSSEHFLSNRRMNRRAWIGQSSMCLATSVPRKYRYGFKYLTKLEAIAANQVAQEIIDQWQLENGFNST